MPETTPLIKAALNLRVGAGFDVYDNPALTQALIPAILDSSLYRYKQKKGKKIERIRNFSLFSCPSQCSAFYKT